MNDERSKKARSALSSQASNVSTQQQILREMDFNHVKLCKYPTIPTSTIKLIQRDLFKMRYSLRQIEYRLNLMGFKVQWYDNIRFLFLFLSVILSPNTFQQISFL